MQSFFSPSMVLYTLWNLGSFMLVMLDKRRAQQNEWRISERIFFLWALVFGAAGILLGMYVFRHKTHHRLFTVGVPILGVCNIVCGYFLWQRGLVLL